MPTKKERLAALEIAQQLNQERIADLLATRGSLLAEMSQRVDHAERKLNELTTAFALHNNAVVDGQAILGREQAALAARLDKLEQKMSGPFWQDESPELTPGRAALAKEWATPFPAGAATTVDEVLAAVPPTDDGPPRRGDRVRLEGARFVGRGGVIPDGWYDVVGQEFGQFQFVLSSDLRRLGWLPNDHPGVKEIRRGTTQPQRPAIEPVDDKDLDV